MADSDTITFERRRARLVKEEEELAAAARAGAVAVAELTPGFEAAFHVWVGLRQAWACSILGRYEARRDARIAGGGVGGVSVETLMRPWIMKLQKFMASEHEFSPTDDKAEALKTKSDEGYQTMMATLRRNFPPVSAGGREEDDSQSDWKQRIRLAYHNMKDAKDAVGDARAVLTDAEVRLRNMTRGLDRLMRKRAEQLHDRSIVDRRVHEQQQQEQARFERWLAEREMEAHGGHGDEMMSEEHIDYDSDSTDDGKMWDHASGFGAPPEWTRRLGLT